ncbi:MAG: calcium-binding protein [Pseudomonadota bacterium]
MDRDFFGVNVLSGRDALDGTFGGKASDLGAQHMRWPGGGISEKHFDMAAPDAMPAASDGSVLGISSYLAASAEMGMRPIIVLPTKRFGEDVAAATAELTTFLTALAQGRYGPVDGVLFEIGNEYYSGSEPYDALSAEEYAALAQAYVTTIEDILPEADIAVQIGRTQAENETIRAVFAADQDAAAAIDVLSFHEYPWRFDPVEDRIAAKMALVDDWQAEGVEADAYMSEWNIGSSPDASQDAAHDYGHAQLSSLLEIADQSIKQGVDIASVWAVQQSNKTSLTAPEGRSKVFAAGDLFQLMQESMIDKRAIEVEDAALEAQGVHLYAYSGGNEFTLFVAARDLAADKITVTLDFPGLDAVLGLAWGERLTPLGDPEAYRPEARLTSFLQPLNSPDSVTVNLNRDYEIVRLDFALSSADQPGRTFLGDGMNNVLRATAGSDRLIGGTGDDFLAAGAGHDRLVGDTGDDVMIGAAGRDILNGQGGNDVMVGGDDNDILYGQSGDDRIAAGAGADRLMGDAGADILNGQAGDDILQGGAGFDRLIGGTGTDVFIFTPEFDLDVVLDFETGTDLLKLRSMEDITGFADLRDGHLSQRPGGALITSEDGMILLRGIDMDALRADDFIF